MPKRGKSQRSWRNNKTFDDFKESYFEHDDRGADNTRRVSFKGGNRISKHGRQSESASVRVRALLEDDIDMVGNISQSTSRGRFSAFGGSRGSRMKRGRGSGRISQHSQHAGKQKLVDQTGWFRIFLPWGAKNEKNYLLGVLRSHISPLELVPIAYRVENQDAAFFVDDLKVAEALQDADRKIVINGGFRLSVKVTNGMPRVDMTDTLKERIKLAMVKRYNTATKALDLSRFHLDPDLVEDSFCAVARPQVLNVIMEIVEEHIPELQALNLDHNCIYVPDALNVLARKAPNMKVLYLGNNRIRDLPTLLSIMKNLDLIELKIEGNPLCKKYDSKSELTSAVRKALNKLMKLDGVDLPPVISFDVEEDVKARLPPWQDTFLCAEGGRIIAKQFVEQYFQLYDVTEGTRQPLLEAYHEQAMFSLTSTYPPGQSQPTGPKLNTYISDSRNLLRITDKERRNKMLRVGKLGIVSFLSELPRTQHDPNSFSLDLTVFSPHLISISLTGVFKEPGVKATPLRYFLRKFVLVPIGAGYCIINEMLFVTNATPQQIKAAFVTPVQPVVQSIPPVQQIQPVVQPNGMKEVQMVEALAVQTNMNIIWARKCLEETQWDIQRAFLAFQDLNSQGRVPPEAFLK